MPHVSSPRLRSRVLAVPVFLATLVGLGLAAPEPREVDNAVGLVHASALLVPAPVPVIVAPVVEALQMTRSVPISISLPSLGVVSDLMELGLAPDGSLEVPPSAYPAGWYSGAPTPGELGPAILAGHVSYAKQQGVFYDLHLLVPGDEIWVLRADGDTAVFVVTVVGQYPKAEFPTDAVYGNLDHAGLRLITCGGEFDTSANSHRDNIVVFAQLSRVQPA